MVLVAAIGDTELKRLPTRSTSYIAQIQEKEQNK